MRFDLDVWIEFDGRLFRNLRIAWLVICNMIENARSTYQCLGLLDVLMSEEELAIQVGEIDGIEVYNVDLAETGENNVL
jgi:hypothetical protein